MPLLLTWAAAYAVITLTLAGLGPVVNDWPMPLRTLLLTAIMVPVMTYGAAPVIDRLSSAITRRRH